MNMMGRSSILLIFFLLVAFGEGRDIYVATNGAGGGTPLYDTWGTASSNIEWAVNVGVNDDTVWISNGTYYLTNQITVNSNITIRGNPGELVVVNGNNANRCFYFTNTVNKGGVLSNLFITGGYANNHGGGAWIQYGTVQDCIFSNNICATNGGGIYFPGTGLVKNCTFVDNKAYNGGGLFVTNGGTLVVVDYCVFHTNIAGYNGGGIYFDRSTITGCVFTCNVATNDGGGAYFFYAGKIKNCTIVSNIAGSLGGGINCDPNPGSRAYISDCFISNNIAGTAGGGVRAYWTTISNCVIARNQCLFTGGTWNYYGGGGVSLSLSSLIYNSIIKENIAARYGGGIHFADGGTARSCLIRNNTATNGGGGVCMGNPASSKPGMSGCTIVSNSVPDGQGGGTYDSISLANTYAIYDNCIIYFNSASGEASNCYVTANAIVAFTNCCFSPALTSAVAVSYSINNITADPQFVDKDTGNWRLRANSPCINTGTNESWMTTTWPYDLDGGTRIRYGTVDMGAYEAIYEGTIFRIP